MVAHNDQPNTRRQTIWRVNLFYTYTNRKWIGDQYEELIGSISSRYKLCVREEKRFGRRKYVENNIYSWGIMTVITVEFKFIFSNFLSLTLFLFFFLARHLNPIELSCRSHLWSLFSYSTQTRSSVLVPLLSRIARLAVSTREFSSIEHAKGVFFNQFRPRSAKHR